MRALTTKYLIIIGAKKVLDKLSVILRLHSKAEVVYRNFRENSAQTRIDIQGQAGDHGHLGGECVQGLRTAKMACSDPGSVPGFFMLF